MINNSALNIHTNYVPDSIFKPQDANALAQSVSYDYVITKERVDAYRAKYSYSQSQWLDVGELLWDGAAFPGYPTGRTSISIFFNFYTTIEDRFLFSWRLSTLSNYGVTAVHIYSLSSYRADGGCGTFDLYYHTSGAENYVLFDSSGMYRGHSVYVGSFACTSGTAIWNSGAPFVYERCISGEIPHGTGSEVVDVRQESWLSNGGGGGSGGSGSGHAIAVMLAPQYCGAPDTSVNVWVGATNGHAININTAINGGPVQSNGSWTVPFVRANTLKVDGKALMSADHCQNSSDGLDVSGISRLDIFTAAGVVTLPKGTWYTATGGVKTYYYDVEYAFGAIYPAFYIKGSTLQEGQQLEISINIVQLPPHSFELKNDPYQYVAPAWQSGVTYHIGDVVSYNGGGGTNLYEALVEAPSWPGGSVSGQWEIVGLSLNGYHAQAIPGRTKVWSSETYYSLYVVDNSGTQLPLYSWGYADPSLNGPWVNSRNTNPVTFSAMHPSFIDTKSSLAGASPAGFGILASSQLTLCKVDGKILVLGSAYSGYYYNTKP